MEIVYIRRPLSALALVESTDDMPPSSLHLDQVAKANPSSCTKILGYQTSNQHYFDVFLSSKCVAVHECNNKWNNTRGMHYRGKSERALYVRRNGGAFHKRYSSGEAQGRRDEHHHGVWGTVHVTRSESAAVGSFG